MTSSPRNSNSGASQWPVFALIGGAHLAALIWVFTGVALPARMSAGSKTSILIFLFFWTAGEALLLTLLNVSVERLSKDRFGRTLDATKALALGAFAAALAASYTKLRLTGLHLTWIDIRYAVHSLGQLQQEASGAERLYGLLFLSGAVVGALVFYGLLRLFRDRPLRARPAGVAILLVACIGGGALMAWTRPAAGVFGQRCVAELAWLTRSEEPLRAGPKIALASHREALSGPRIQPYAPDVYGQPPNVVLVMLESLPWKRTAFGGGPVDAMPKITRLADDSVLFSHAYTAATHSDYAQMAILSSLFPRKYEGHDFYTRLDYPRSLIWDALHAAGYRTALFSCQNETWGNMVAFERTPGLDVFRDSNDFPDAPHKGTGLESKVYEKTVFDAWKTWLSAGRTDESKAPFFTYLNFQADHFPYEIPDDAPHPFSPFTLDFPYSYLSYPKTRIPDMLNRFYNALSYSDHYVGQVVETLKSAGLWKHTVLVVVSDHGEAFYEHGLPTHGTTLHEEQVRSLLMMHVPGHSPGRVDQPVSLLDVAPTLLRVLGLAPNGNFQGRGDILEPSYSARNRPLFFTIQGLTEADGLLLNRQKYIVDWQRHLRELYDLQTDPGEQTNRVRTDAKAAGELDARLRRFLGRQLAYYGTQGWKQDHYPPALP